MIIIGMGQEETHLTAVNSGENKCDIGVVCYIHLPSLSPVKTEVKLYRKKPGDCPAFPHPPILSQSLTLGDKGAVFIILLHISSQIHICVTHIVRPRARCDDDCVARHTTQSVLISVRGTLVAAKF